MIRRAYIIGIITLGLAAGAVHTSPMVCRVVTSAKSFHHYFQDLKEAGTSLSPIERFMFSLVVADTKAPRTESRSAAPERRT